mmetsp:Transcript_34970/g.110480  ORF Transcript_34970/g.110480 Transcript_34970/m.110480 type:complete len:336 (-) Transcript_34970:327-1334(-)
MTMIWWNLVRVFQPRAETMSPSKSTVPPPLGEVETNPREDASSGRPRPVGTNSGARVLNSALGVNAGALGLDPGGDDDINALVRLEAEPDRGTKAGASVRKAAAAAAAAAASFFCTRLDSRREQRMCRIAACLTACSWSPLTSSSDAMRKSTAMARPRALAARDDHAGTLPLRRCRAMTHCGMDSSETATIFWSRNTMGPLGPPTTPPHLEKRVLTSAASSLSFAGSGAWALPGRIPNASMSTCWMRRPLPAARSLQLARRSAAMGPLSPSPSSLSSPPLSAGESKAPSEGTPWLLPPPRAGKRDSSLIRGARPFRPAAPSPRAEALQEGGEEER